MVHTLNTATLILTLLCIRASPALGRPPASFLSLKACLSSRPRIISDPLACIRDGQCEQTQICRQEGLKDSFTCQRLLALNETCQQEDNDECFSRLYCAKIKDHSPDGLCRPQFSIGKKCDKHSFNQFASRTKCSHLTNQCKTPRFAAEGGRSKSMSDYAGG